MLFRIYSGVIIRCLRFYQVIVHVLFLHRFSSIWNSHKNVFTFGVKFGLSLAVKLIWNINFAFFLNEFMSTNSCVNFRFTTSQTISINFSHWVIYRTVILPSSEFFCNYTCFNQTFIYTLVLLCFIIKLILTVAPLIHVSPSFIFLWTFKFNLVISSWLLATLNSFLLWNFRRHTITILNIEICYWILLTRLSNLFLNNLKSCLSWLL